MLIKKAITNHSDSVFLGRSRKIINEIYAYIMENSRFIFFLLLPVPSPISAPSMPFLHASLLFGHRPVYVNATWVSVILTKFLSYPNMVIVKYICIYIYINVATHKKTCIYHFTVQTFILIH